MKTAGSAIRNARLARNMSLEELHRRTKIAPAVLQSIENGTDPGLPATTLRGFARSICTELGLDIKKVLPYLPDARHDGNHPDRAAFSVRAVRPVLASLTRPGTLILAAVMCMSAAVYLFFAKKTVLRPGDIRLLSVSVTDSLADKAPTVLADSALYYAQDIAGIHQPEVRPDTSISDISRTVENDTAVVVTGRIPMDELESILPGFRAMKEQARIDSSSIEQLEQLNPRISVLVFFGTWDLLSVRVVARITALSERAFLPGVTVSTVGVSRDMHDSAGLSDLHSIQDIPSILFVARGVERGRISGLAGEQGLYTIENEMIRIARDTEIFIKAEYDESP